MPRSYCWTIVLLDYKDPSYSLQAIKTAQLAKQTDDVSDCPVVYVEVKEMAPVKSRLQKVEVLESPPEYAVP